MVQGVTKGQTDPQKGECSLVPRPSPAPFSWPCMWPLNCQEKQEKT